VAELYIMQQPPKRFAATTTSGLETRTDVSDRRELSAQDRRGLIRFTLQLDTGGVYVEREDHPTRGLRTIQSIAFPDVQAFEQWCDDDPVRFEHPLLHAQLKREGGELWRAFSEPRES